MGWRAARAALIVVLLLIIIAALHSARAAGAAVLVIDHGGTYSGTWESDDANIPCVRVKTAEPVVIENSTLRGRGALIVSTTRHSDITIRNTRGVGVNPNVSGRAVGRFVSIERFDRVTIENCSVEQTAGIYLLDYLGDHTPGKSVRIVRSRAKNIDGRKSDGKGGYLAGVAPEIVQFVQLDKVRHVPGVEIGWNEVINEPGNSAVEDNISIYLSSGTAESPIEIHDNFIRGGYPFDPARGNYSGGGIMLGDGIADAPADDASFVRARDNQVLDTVNYGIAISAGHDCALERNRIVSAGVLPDRTPIAAQNTGAYIWDSYKAGKEHFFNNTGRENVIGWIKRGREHAERNDWWTPGAAAWERNASWPDPITPAVYGAEWKRWREKLHAAQITVGPAETR